MPDCRYCDRTFGDEDAYLDHLEADHGNELGRLDRRRIEERGNGGHDLDVAPVALIAVLGIAAAIVAYVVLVPGGGGSAANAVAASTTPSGLGAVHVHGSIEVVIDGQRVDFSQSRYQLQADAFHFENGEGSRWHVHARDVTLEWAMGTVGIGVARDTVTFEGDTYREDDPGTTVTVEVNGEPVRPATYILREGDAVRIVVRAE